MNTQILTRAESGVLTISINRVECKNALTSAMYTALANALTAAETDPSLRVVLLQGHEAVFSAGNDMGEFLNAAPSGAESPVSRFIQCIASFPKPLLAAVCGPAVGIGTTMLFHCDLVYAGDNASFSMPFVNLGLCPEAGSGLLASQMFGFHRAAELFLFGESLTAQDAFRFGLVNKVLPAAEVNAFALEQARKLTTKPLSSLLEIKRLMKKSQQSVVRQQIVDEGDTFKRMLTEPASKEALTAFMEKRRSAQRRFV